MRVRAGGFNRGKSFEGVSNVDGVKGEGGTHGRVHRMFKWVRGVRRVLVMSALCFGECW